VLDTDKGVPLVMKLAGTIGFSREGRRFTMQVSVDSLISGLGSARVIATPADTDVVATPERLREVDDRDYLLQGIAPPLRRNPDGTAVPPAPLVKPGAVRPPDKLPDKAKASDPASPPANRKPRSDDPPKRRATPGDGAKP